MKLVPKTFACVEGKSGKTGVLLCLAATIGAGLITWRNHVSGDLLLDSEPQGCKCVSQRRPYVHVNHEIPSSKQTHLYGSVQMYIYFKRRLQPINLPGDVKLLSFCVLVAQLVSSTSDLVTHFPRGFKSPYLSLMMIFWRLGEDWINLVKLTCH